MLISTLAKLIIELKGVSAWQSDGESIPYGVFYSQITC